MSDAISSSSPALTVGAIASAGFQGEHQTPLGELKRIVG